MTDETTEAQAEPAEGQVHADDLVQPETTEAEAPKERLSNEEVAQEVVAGHWGRGHNRVRRLEEAGYDPVAVQAKVNEIFDR